MFGSFARTMFKLIWRRADLVFEDEFTGFLESCDPGTWLVFLVRVESLACRRVG